MKILLLISSCLVTLTTANPLRLISNSWGQDFSWAPARNDLLHKRLTPGEEVCGASHGDMPAASSRIPQLWNDLKMDDWLKTTAGEFFDRKWFYTDAAYKTNDLGKKAPNVQMFAYQTAGPEGHEPCKSITAECTHDAASTCPQFPEGEFFIFAIDHFASWLHNLYEALQSISIWALGMCGSWSTWFYTPRTPLSQALLPLSIASGIAAGLTSFAIFDPTKYLAFGAALSGIMTIIQGALTIEELKRPDPNKQWKNSQTQVATLFNAFVNKMTDMYDSLLYQPMLETSGSFVGNSSSLYGILLKGPFASQAPPIRPLDNTIKAMVATGPVNGIWLADGVFIVKMTDKAMHNPKGGVCAQHSDVSVCDPDHPGTAYFFIRWRSKESVLADPQNGVEPIDPKKWHVRGAYDSGTDKDEDGHTNTNHLPDIGLDLLTIARSAERTQQEKGLLFVDDYATVSDQLIKENIKLKLDDVIRWNLPVCDIEAILAANGYDHLKGGKDNKDQMWYTGIPCSCRTIKGWGDDSKSEFAKYYQVKPYAGSSLNDASKPKDPKVAGDNGKRLCTDWLKASEDDEIETEIIENSPP